MKPPFLPWAVLVATALVPGCSSREVSVLRPENLPRTVAVLAPTGGNLTSFQRLVLRRLVGNLIEQRGYYTLADPWVDRQLAASGVRPWEPDWFTGRLPGDMEPEAEVSGSKSAGNGKVPVLSAEQLPWKDLECDAVVVLRGFEDSMLQLGVHHRRRLDGHMMMLDRRTGERIFESHMREVRRGGLVMGSGQAFRAVSDSVNSGDARHFVFLTAKNVLLLAPKVPMNPEPGPVRRRPVVESISSAEVQGEVPSLRVELAGSPGCQAFVSVSGTVVNYPLLEVGKGRYLGSIPRSEVRGKVVLSGFLRDPAGATSLSYGGGREQ